MIMVSRHMHKAGWTKMNSKEIQEHIEQWAIAKKFNAPYGVLTGEHTNKKGRKYLFVTFGRCRTLDATVSIYNRNFIMLETSRFGRQIFKHYDELQKVLDTL